MTSLTGGVIFAILFVISLALGFAYHQAFVDTKEFSTRYDDVCGSDPNCTIQIRIEQDMVHPIYIYYQLSNFYQNHFLYMKSKSDEQLSGDPFDPKVLQNCRPFASNGSNEVEDVYVPCGAIARSVFTDSFTFGENFPNIFTYGLVDPGEYRKYRTVDNSYTNSIHWLDDRFPGGQKNDRFINWMHIAAFPTFRKLWARIPSEDLPAGVYNVTIENNYDVSSFDGTKSLIIAQVSWIGGKNSFFAIFFLAIAGISFITSVVLFILHFCKLSPLLRAVQRVDDPLQISLFAESPSVNI